MVFRFTRRNFDFSDEFLSDAASVFSFSAKRHREQLAFYRLEQLSSAFQRQDFSSSVSQCFHLFHHTSSADAFLGFDFRRDFERQKIAVTRNFPNADFFAMRHFARGIRARFQVVFRARRICQHDIVESGIFIFAEKLAHRCVLVSRDNHTHRNLAMDWLQYDFLFGRTAKHRQRNL